MTPGELRDLYDRELRRRLANLEPLRRQIARGRLGGPLVKLFGLTALVAPVFLREPGDAMIDSMITAFLVPASVGLAIHLFVVKPAQRQTSLYCRRFKDEVLRELIEKLLPGARFEAGGQDVTGGGDAAASGLFAAPDFLRHSAEDHLSGKLGATVWHAADLHLYEPSDHQLAEFERRQRVVSRPRPRTLFRGFFLELTLKHSFSAHTIVESHGPRAAATLEHAALDAVPLDDAAFDQAFQVKSSSAEEARELLGPTLRAELLALRRDLGRPLLLSFAEKHAWLAVPCDGDLFEPELRETTSLESIQLMAGLLQSVELLASETAGVKTARASRTTAASVAANAPSRPTRSLIRVRRAEGRLQIDYLGSVSWVAVLLTGLAAPAVIWFWLLWVEAVRGAKSDYDSSGILFVALPLFVFTLVWLFFAQSWWRPVRRLDVGRDEVSVLRGVFRRTRVPRTVLAAIESRKTDEGPELFAGSLPLSPPLRNAEAPWLLHELRTEGRSG